MDDKRFLSPREFIETERANWAKWSMCDVSYENCTCVCSCHRKSHTGRDLRPPPIIVTKSLMTGIVKTDPKIGKRFRNARTVGKKDLNSARKP